MNLQSKKLFRVDAVHPVYDGRYVDFIHNDRIFSHLIGIQIFFFTQQTTRTEFSFLFSCSNCARDQSPIA